MPPKAMRMPICCDQFQKPITSMMFITPIPPTRSDIEATINKNTAQLGMVFDPSSSAESAYRLGRSGNILEALDGQLRALESGENVAPVIVFDQRVANQYLQTLAKKIDQPAVEASLHLNGTNVVAQAGQIGRILNVDATLTYLGARLQTFTDGEVPLVI